MCARFEYITDEYGDGGKIFRKRKWVAKLKTIIYKCQFTMDIERVKKKCQSNGKAEEDLKAAKGKAL